MRWALTFLLSSTGRLSAVSRVRRLERSWQQKNRRKCIRYVNRDYNVARLCRDFPSRLRKLVHREGARLPH